MLPDNVIQLKSSAVEAPAVVSQSVTLGALDYLRRLQQLGAIEGAVGEQSVCHELIPIVEALHHVLAGGEVEVKVKSQGNVKIVGELDALFCRTLRESNEINDAAGYRAVPLIV